MEPPSPERSPKRLRLSSSDESEGLPPYVRRVRAHTPSAQLRSRSEEHDSDTSSVDGFSYDSDRNLLRAPSVRKDHVSSDASSGHDSDYTNQASSPVTSPALQTFASQIRYRPSMILRGHKRAVAAVKFSPDGRWIASCSADATVKIWNATTGRLEHTLEGHLAGVSTIAWNPDSRLLASGSDDKSIRFWDAVSGKPHPEPLLGHHNYVYCLAFSPKGNILVSGSYDEAVFLWNVRSGRLMRSLPAHGDPVSGVDFVRDGTLIVSCASDGLIRVWDTATGQCLRTFFHEDTPPVVSVKFSPNGKYILTWMLDSSVRMWNYTDGRCVKTYQGHKNEQYSIVGAFGTYNEAASAFIASGSENGSILFWDVVSKHVLQTLNGHAGTVFGVDTHPTEKKVISCGQDQTIRIWIDEPSHREYDTEMGEDEDS